MSTTAQQVSDRAGILLGDTSLVRWPGPERMLWINDGRREMAYLKPEVFGHGAEVTHTLTTGNRQVVTASGAYRIVSVDSHDSRAVRPTTRELLDAFRPQWSVDTGAKVQNWFSDQADPLSFWVYPQSTGTMKLHVNITPSDLTSMSDTALPFDIYASALTNYVCYRALSKEDEAGAAEKAAAFYQRFTAALS